MFCGKSGGLDGFGIVGSNNCDMVISLLLEVDAATLQQIRLKVNYKQALTFNQGFSASLPHRFRSARSRR